MDLAVCKDNSCLLSSRGMLTQQSTHPAHAFPTVTASARLEKTSKIIQSNHSPTTNISFPLRHVPHYNIQCSLNTHRDSSSITSLGSPFQRLTAHWEKLFFTSNLNLPSCNLRPFPLVLALVPCEKRTTPHLHITTRHVIGQSEVVFPQPPLLHTNESHFPQPLPIRLVLYNPHSFIALLWTHFRLSGAPL